MFKGLQCSWEVTGQRCVADEWYRCQEAFTQVQLSWECVGTPGSHEDQWTIEFDLHGREWENSGTTNYLNKQSLNKGLGLVMIGRSEYPLQK